MRFDALLRENVPLAPMTTLGIGGPARYFADVSSAEELSAGVEWSRSRGISLFVLGGGSNIVVADGGFPGLVLRVCISGVEATVRGDQVEVDAGAGEEWDSLVGHCVANNWSGLECLSGIPGRVGATPIQNVGAYGQETSETLVSIEATDLTELRMIRLSSSECEFGYRTSRFKTRDRDRFVITRVSYRLTVGGAPAVRYPELQRYLTGLRINSPTVADVRKAVLAIRRRKAMVIDPNDIDSRSVGSFFVNPALTREQFEKFKSRASGLVSNLDEIPSFPAPDGLVKLSAAWLIERAGIMRGHARGNVGTSSKHALAIINRGGGTASEVMELKELIQSRVFDSFGIALAPEPVFVGFD
ncbi:MAG TPA: UDP-N-acetylmuramate dehydrogenase [Blastocatellia bacterium]|nr:UDP-N-acetylmuramate dehydrogenase [Blastocatellia bacterium]